MSLVPVIFTSYVCFGAKISIVVAMKTKGNIKKMEFIASVQLSINYLGKSVTLGILSLPSVVSCA